MKTISEFAKENNVSVQTIYRKLNKGKHLHESSLTEKVNGITYITALGEDALLSCLTPVKQDSVKTLNTVKQDNIETLNTVKQDGAKMLNTVEQDNAEMLNTIKQDDTKTLNTVKQDNAKAFNVVKHPESGDITYFKEQNRLLQEELSKEREHSRAQADKLAALAEQLAELSRNNQILLVAEQRRANPGLLSAGGQPDEEGQGQPVKKKSFWGLFRRS